MPKTSKKQFKVYIDACQKWINIFGLKSYRIVFRHTPLGPDTAAQCTWAIDSGTAYLDFNANIDEDDDFSDCEIKRYALHEVLHLVFGRVHTLAGCRYTTDDEVNQEFHALIRLFENVLLGG